MNLAFVGMAAALGLSASGSAFGAGFAGQAAVGAWKKCYASGKPAPFIMIAFAGAPLTQTIYGFLLMNFIKSAVEGGADAGLALGVGIFCGLAIGLSALFQGKCAAGASDALMKPVLCLPSLSRKSAPSWYPFQDCCPHGSLHCGEALRV